MTKSTRMTLDFPDDPDETRVNAAIEEYLLAEESGPVDETVWLSRQPIELRTPLSEFLSSRRALAALRPAPSRTVPLALQDFGRYCGLRLIGKGGMGAVYRARDSVLDRLVAVKFLHADLAVQGSDADRFLREARVVARLQHRNIVPVYDYGSMPGNPPRPYFTMQLIAGTGDDPRGQTFQAVVREHRTNPSAVRFHSLVAAFLGVCDAVTYAHSADVLHRDLKPANVLMMGERDVLVVDWGLSKVLSPDGKQTTGIGGTPEYLSPEAATGGTVGKPADVFGLGGILTQLLTGESVYKPSQGTSASALAANRDTTGCINRLNACGAPEELVRLAVQCLSVEPEKRPTAAEVTAAVAGYLATVEERVKAAEIESSRAQERAAQEYSRRKAVGLFAAGAVAFVLLSALVGLWYLNDRAEQQRQEDLAEQGRTVEANSRRELVSTAVLSGLTALQSQQFSEASTALERARGALDSAAPASLVDSVFSLEKFLRVARLLDDIRQEWTVRNNDPQLPNENLIRRYSEAFAELGIDPASEKAAGQIASSPLRNALVIALEDWAQHSDSNSPRSIPVARLLTLARQVAPDREWLNRFRDPAIRTNPAQLSALAATAPLQRLSVADVVALVRALPPADPSIPRLFATVETRYPNHFWQLMANTRWRCNQMSSSLGSPVTIQEAVSLARTAVALRPDSLAAWMLLAQLYAKSNQQAELDAVATRMSALDASSWMTNSVAALAARKRMKYREALVFLRRAADGEGHPPDRRLEIADLHARMGDFDLALAVAESVQKAFPESLRAKSQYALCLAFAGRWNEAEQQSRAVLAIDPKYSPAHRVIALVLFSQGRLAAAEESLAKGRPDREEAFETTPLQGLIELCQGKYEKVLAMLDHAESDEERVMNNPLRFLALVHLGRLKEAQACLEQTARLQADIIGTLAEKLGLSRALVSIWKWYVDQLVIGESKQGFDPLLAFSSQRLEEMQGLDRLMLPHWADLTLARHWTLASSKLYLESLVPRSPLSGGLGSQSSLLFLLGSYQFHAARAAACASTGNGKDGFRASDSRRAECRTAALRWLTAELATCREYAAQKTAPSISTTKLMGGATNPAANVRLHLMKWHPDLAAVREKAMIAEMPEADRKMAEALWASVEELYQQLNPPVNLPVKSR